jgi:nucleoside-diphosphate-sugar epimerase
MQSRASHSAFESAHGAPRVLITGASGFVGMHVVRRFAKAGWQVHAQGRTEHSRAQTPAMHCRWHVGNLLDLDAIAALIRQVAPTHLVHLAWTTEHGHFWNDAANALWVKSSLALLDAFAQQGGQHAFMAGSCAEYEWGDPVLQAGVTPLRAATLYGRCKADLSAAVHGRAAAIGLPCSWGRLFFPYGPGERAQRLIPYLAHTLLSGQDAATGPAHFERDFLHVEDVADVIFTASQRAHSGVLDVCSGEGTSIGSVATELARLANASQRLRLGQLTARQADVEKVVGSTTSLQALGWTPRVNLQIGLAQTVAWWRGQLLTQQVAA